MHRRRRTHRHHLELRLRRRPKGALEAHCTTCKKNDNTLVPILPNIILVYSMSLLDRSAFLKSWFGRSRDSIVSTVDAPRAPLEPRRLPRVLPQTLLLWSASVPPAHNVPRRELCSLRRPAGPCVGLHHRRALRESAGAQRRAPARAAAQAGTFWLAEPLHGALTGL